MGLVDKFKNFVNPVDQDDYSEENYDYESEDSGDYGTGYEEEYAPTQPNQRMYKQQQPPRQNNNYDYRDEPQQHAPSGNVEMKKIVVEKWSDVKAITNHLQNHRIILIDISGVQVDLARRMLDFLYGVLYVIDGKLQRVDTKTWLATPSNVNYSIDKKSLNYNRSESSFIDSEDL